jgi:hypothetical protein
MFLNCFLRFEWAKLSCINYIMTMSSSKLLIACGLFSMEQWLSSSYLKHKPRPQWLAMVCIMYGWEGQGPCIWIVMNTTNVKHAIDFVFRTSHCIAHLCCGNTMCDHFLQEGTMKFRLNGMGCLFLNSFQEAILLQNPHWLITYAN